MKKRNVVYVFWALMFAGIFLILCNVGYSDGDDAFFYEYTHQMGFLDYLLWRYQTWVGRMAAEALIYLVFHMGLWFWRLANAFILVLLPIGILHLAKKCARAAGYGIGAAAGAASCYLMMSVMTLGYAAIWVNGSVFYTWSFTCGIYALFPLADIVYGKNKEQGPWWKYLYALPFSVLAAMSIEQMGAVLLAFLVSGIIYLFWRKKRIPIFLLVQTGLTAVSFLILFLAPGNAMRVAAETQNWLPQYTALSFGEHLFLTIQWLLSSFANENVLFFIAIWMAGGVLLSEKKEHPSWLIGGGIYALAGILAFAGISLFSDLGLHIADITVRIDQVPSAGDMTVSNWFALIWWIGAVVFTFAFLWKVSECNITILLVYLAGIASEAVMYFSPTIYASGARVYYLTDLLFLFVILNLSMQIREKGRQNRFYVLLVLFGAANLIRQLPILFP